MKVGIIGTNWGRVHIGTFRSFGCSIHTLMGLDLQKTRAVADEEGIPHATTSPGDLLEVDVVVIATPADSHLSYLEFFRDKAVLCEKPLCARLVDPDVVQRFSHRPAYVNYAFPFLETAVQMKSFIDQGRLGEVFRIIVNVSPNFDLPHSPLDWFMDDAVHPLSWLNHVFPPFELVHYHSSGARPDISTVLTNGMQTLNLNLYRAPSVQLHFDITVAGTHGVMKTSGGFMPGRCWNFEPVSINGEAVTSGEHSGHHGDIWYHANRRAVGVFLDAVSERISHEQAVNAGLADVAKAACIENGLAMMVKGMER